MGDPANIPVFQRGGNVRMLGLDHCAKTHRIRRRRSFGRRSDPGNHLRAHDGFDLLPPQLERRRRSANGDFGFVGPQAVRPRRVAAVG